MAETTVTIESTLTALVEGKRYATLRDILVTMNPSDVAAVFEEMDEAALPLLFRLLGAEILAAVCGDAAHGIGIRPAQHHAAVGIAAGFRIGHLDPVAAVGFAEHPESGRAGGLLLSA